MLNPRNPRTPRSGHDHVPTHVPAACFPRRTWNGRASILLDNRQPTCPEGYSLPRTPRKKFDPTIYYGPRATPEPGKPWWCLDFLGIQFPPMPTESVHHGTFLPLFCTGISMFQGLPIPHMHRNRYDRPPCCNGNGIPPHLHLPLPLSRERYAMQPIESSESVATV